MALKQLMIQKKIEQRKATLEKIFQETETLKNRSDELEKALEEAETDEEVSIVEESVAALEAEKEENDQEKT